MQALCQALQREGRVDTLVGPAMASFTEVKEILGLDTFLNLRSELEGA
jgi:hypothetical protein